MSSIVRKCIWRLWLVDSLIHNTVYPLSVYPLYIFSKLIYLNASKRIQFKITLFWFNKKTLLCCRFSMNFPLNRENSFKRPNILIILWFVQFDVCKNKLPRFLYMVRVFLASFIKYPP